jgi:DNA-binding NarL/FixJ family response regulator
MITVLIADDHPIVRSGIRSELAKYSDIKLVGEATNGEEVENFSDTLRPNVILLDINMPRFKAIPFIHSLQAKIDKPHVLILTAYGDTEYVFGTLRAGAEGFMLKDEDASLIAEGIYAVAVGRIWMSKDIANIVVGQKHSKKSTLPEELFTQREFEILQLLAQGYSNIKIAATLALAEGTVKNYVSCIYSKINANSRSEAVAWAWQNQVAKL